MSEDGLSTPGAFAPPPVPEHHSNHLVVEGDAPDPWAAGMCVVAGVLAPLPRRVRLPHEEDLDEDSTGDDEGADGVPDPARF